MAKSGMSLPFPPPLKPRGTIGIIAPSGIPKFEHIDKAKRIFGVGIAQRTPFAFAAPSARQNLT